METFCLASNSENRLRPSPRCTYARCRGAATELALDRDLVGDPPATG